MLSASGSAPEISLTTQAQIPTPCQHLPTCSTSLGRASPTIFLLSNVHSYHPANTATRLAWSFLLTWFIFFFNCFWDMLWWISHFKSCWLSLSPSPLSTPLARHLFTRKSMEALIGVRICVASQHKCLELSGLGKGNKKVPISYLAPQSVFCHIQLPRTLQLPHLRCSVLEQADPCSGPSHTEDH